MSVIYVVTEGEYSDYHIVGLYSSEETAAAAAQKCDGGRVEEYELDGNADLVARGYWVYSVVMDIDGNTAQVYEYGAPGSVSSEGYICKWHSDETLHLSAKVCAKSKEHAVKIANDKRAQIIALGNWRNGYKLDAGE